MIGAARLHTASMTLAVGLSAFGGTAPQASRAGESPSTGTGVTGLAGPGPEAVRTTGSPVTVPFQFENGQIVVSASIGAVGSYRFFLDTGTNPSIVDLGTARALGFTLGEPSNTGAGAGTGMMDVRRCLLPPLAIGALTAAGLEAAAVDLSGISSGFGGKVDGVLGYGFLKDRIVTIDYAARCLVFYPSAGLDRGALFKRGRGRKILPFEFYGEDRTPFTHALSVGGSPALPVTLDTGSSGFAALYHATALRLGWKGRLESAPIKSGEGYRGLFPSAVLRVESVSFAGFDLVPEEVTVPLPGSHYGEDADVGAEGNVGNALLSKFRITLDYPNRVLLVERADAAGSKDRP